MNLNKGISTPIAFAIIIAVAIVTVGGIFGYQYLNQLKESTGTNNDQNIVGGDKDEHGCIGSAGYSWCETKQKCLRTWEESCEAVITDQTADWETYTNNEYGFEIKYPKYFIITETDQWTTLSFPSSYNDLSYNFNNDVSGASINLGVGLSMIGELNADNWCQKFEKGSDKDLIINNLNFIKGIFGSAAMGGWYTEYTVYRIMHNNNCYEIALVVNGQGPGAGANDGKGPLPEDYSSNGDKKKFISITEEILSTLKFIK